MEPPKPYREERPWGGFVEFTRNTPSSVKVITVNPGESLSLQNHAKRDEFWLVLSGTGTITNGTNQIPASAGETHWIPRGINHRLEAGNEPLKILEISFGDFQDSDIVRLEDKYGRK